MGLSKLISLSVVLASLAVGTGNLPWALKHVRKAQFELIQDSKASKWPKAVVLSSLKIKTNNYEMNVLNKPFPY